MARPSNQDVTQMLLAWNRGDPEALEKLTPLVYEELRRLAHWHMVGERPDHMLQTTALVHEAYLHLIDCQRVQWQNRAQFFALSSRLMRRILVDFARSRQSLKRGGDALRISLDGAAVPLDQGLDFVALEDALNALAGFDPRRAQVVELRFFGGLSVKEAAEVLKVSTDTVKRDWRLAKVWLLGELRGEQNDEG